MKLFIASQGKELNSLLDERFARANYFIIVDSETKNIIKTFDNTSLNDAHGVGIKIANMAINENVDVAIGVHFGPKALDGLSQGHIDAYQAEIKTIDEIIDDFNNGVLKKQQ